MFKTKTNILLIVMASISELVVSLLYHFGFFSSWLKWVLIVAAFWGIVIIATNALTNFGKAFAFGFSNS